MDSSGAPATRPHLGRELLGLVATCHAARGVPSALSDSAVAALRAGGLGTHRDVVCAALSRAGGGPPRDLEEVYRSASGRWGIPPDLPVGEIVSALDAEVGGVDVSAAAAAVVGFESCRHVGLVWAAARRLAPVFEIPPAELVSDGWHGLRLALHRYDPRRWEFSTYAVHRIAGAMRDGVRSDSPVPKRLTTLARAATRVEDRLVAELSRPPTRQEVLDGLGALARHAPLLPRLAAQVPLEELFRGEIQGRAVRAVVDPVGADERTLERLRRRDVVTALAALPQAQRHAVLALVGDGLTERQASVVTGLAVGVLRRCARDGLSALGADPRLRGWRPESG